MDLKKLRRMLKAKQNKTTHEKCEKKFTKQGG